MAQPAAHTPPALVRYVPTTYPMAVQAIAALEERMRYLRSHGGQDWAVADCHVALVQLRETFLDQPQPAGATEAEERLLWGNR